MKSTSTYSFTTPRGAQVEATITVEHITTRELDGIEYHCDEWVRHCDEVRVNGKITKQHQLTEWGVKHPSIRIDQRGRDNVYVELPADVIDAVYGEERAADKAAYERGVRLDRWYDERNAQMRAAMDNE